jgi:CTP synthase (UTP-ammonia lyase)
MTRSVSVGLVGNYDATVLAHQAIPGALRNAADTLDIEVRHEWVPSEEIRTTARISGFDGIWCIPGSPYRSTEGALLAIRHARERSVPFLGTCGGFQHAVIEFARNVLGWADAAHGETDPDAERAVIAPLSCGLLNSEGVVRLQPGSRLASAYRSTSTAEPYLCRYGVNPRFLAALVGGPLRVTATDESGDVRAVELDGHRFFVATLFQPERAALQGKTAPVVVEFVRACAK